ncbi:MAG: hypothetical protein QOF02_2070 [Blastocatellia bacterium]|jgi:hypothetical protein|nr:hypothetical protein [Blastocatellia bacterium]
MIDSELQKVVEAWVACQAAVEGSPEYQSNWWAIEKVIDWAVLESEPELLWRFVLAAYQRGLPDTTTAVLAAGPLEDLLSRHGPDYIERVEELARRDARFNHLLGGVWQLEMTDEVWERVKAVRREVW